MYYHIMLPNVSKNQVKLVLVNKFLPRISLQEYTHDLCIKKKKNNNNNNK